MRVAVFLGLMAAIPTLVFAACKGSVGSSVSPGFDAAPRPPPVTRDGSFSSAFCDLPGSVVFGPGATRTIVNGGRSAPDLTWLQLPAGFCAHYFAHVGDARQIRVAPSGELFVASPTAATSGGGPFGVAGVVALFDDDFDGYADGDTLPHADESPQSLQMFLSGLPSTQGILFAPGFFYYQDGTQILKVPYQAGDRSARQGSTMVADITIYSSQTHWPKTLDMADDGTIYVGNGGDQQEVCDGTVFPRPFHGGILELDGTPGGTPVAQGFRNPIAVKCQRGHDLCFATELALDGSGGAGGREKLVPIRKGDDWGYPCCATTNLPYPEVSGHPNCANVAPESASFVLGHTPFGFDFEPGGWPAPFANVVLMSLHGFVGTWDGARIIAIPTQANGLPVATSELSGGTPPIDFAIGWDDGMRDHGRPSDVAFTRDGRAFIANDVNGDIFWVAPVGLSDHADGGPNGDHDAGARSSDASTSSDASMSAD